MDEICWFFISYKTLNLNLTLSKLEKILYSSIHFNTVYVHFVWLHRKDFKIWNFKIYNSKIVTSDILLIFLFDYLISLIWPHSNFEISKLHLSFSKSRAQHTTVFAVGNYIIIILNGHHLITWIYAFQVLSIPNLSTIVLIIFKFSHNFNQLFFSNFDSIDTYTYMCVCLYDWPAI